MTASVQRTDFVVRTRVGVAAFTSTDRDLAVAWVKRHRDLPGLTVEEVTVWQSSRVVYRLRPRLVDDLDIPAIPERKAS